MKPHAQIAIIQYTTDLLRGERINVGMLVKHLDAVGLYMTEDWRRIHEFGGDVPAVQQLANKLGTLDKNNALDAVWHNITTRTTKFKDTCLMEAVAIEWPPALAWDDWVDGHHIFPLYFPVCGLSGSPVADSLDNAVKSAAIRYVRYTLPTPAEDIVC